MNVIFDIFLFLSLIRRCANSGLLWLLARNYKIKYLFLFSWLFAPLGSARRCFGCARDENLSSIAEKLGPIFIKLGQSLSTRPDLIGEEIASSLSVLQDRTQAFAGTIAKNILEKELGQKLEENFIEFEEMPIAAASIAQVHKAKLKSGEIVAVKILRPLIEQVYQKDIKRLFALARIFNKFCTKYKRLKAEEAIAIFEKSMKFELNLLNEAAACSELRSNLSKDTNVFIPEVFWDYSTKAILVLEWIDGFSILDTEKFAENNLKKQDIIQNLLVTFLNQAFRDGFFHADLHPGNILVTNLGQIALVDFGIIGNLSDKDRFGLAEILSCLIQKNYKRVAEIHVEIGYVPLNTNIIDFALACRAASEPIIDKQINKISMGHLLENLLKITADFGMETQPQLILMQKTIIVVEGIAQMIDHEVNIWKLAEPWIKKWALKNIGFDAKIVRLIKHTIKDLEQHYRKII